MIGANAWALPLAIDAHSWLTVGLIVAIDLLYLVFTTSSGRKP